MAANRPPSPRTRIPLDVLRDTIRPFPTCPETYVAALKDVRERIRSADARTTRSVGG
ncbi:hypothetical protein [Streptomyces sp. 3213.3]|uniref:hypothetical protein n=1 Tax=Streptomyces sp. 3213.3 TaxID=1855348 RepID=UPI00135A184C|nr:hypothetical protein [Streptomyces sp. 3213.3]